MNLDKKKAKLISEQDNLVKLRRYMMNQIPDHFTDEQVAQFEADFIAPINSRLRSICEEIVALPIAATYAHPSFS